MATFAELVESRKNWINDVLTPWCREAAVGELRQAAVEWLDIAGKADADATLWNWAWSRFPALVHEGIDGINETLPVRVTLKEGTTYAGYPDTRQGKEWEFCLIDEGGAESPVIGLDEISAVERG